MTSGRGVPAVLMRGGTSKGLFLHARDLPPAGPRRDALVLDLMGSPDPMQIDGLGGTYSSTSKVMVVEPGPEGAVTYWFGQVGIDTPTVDWRGNCGNLTTAVAAFAVDEKLVPPVEPTTRVRMINGNTGVRIEAEVPVRDGRARTDGELRVAGVPRPGSPIVTHYSDPGGAVTGKLLPTGNPVDTAEGPAGPLELSILDVTSAYVFARAADLDIVPHERSVAELNADPDLLLRIERIRGEAARLLGVVDKADDAQELSPVIPRIVLVGPARAPDTDLAVVAVSMGVVHRAVPITAALCLAAAARIPGTLPHGCLAREDTVPPSSALRIAHPLGTVDVLAQVRADGPHVDSVGVVRTARRLMSGIAHPYADHDIEETS
ncbi:PrpF domain-containing protein [Nocardia alni]|uniref:PrpF domain-containing protein n=1 Tax=Nocardia alni TaxID=2815723 RepID=UPI001C22B6C4|nr:PrpF domain-containing protein [Nocardia alni]